MAFFLKTIQISKLEGLTGIPLQQKSLLRCLLNLAPEKAKMRTFVALFRSAKTEVNSSAKVHRRKVAQEERCSHSILISSTMRPSNTIVHGATSQKKETLGGKMLRDKRIILPRSLAEDRHYMSKFVK